MAIHNKSELLAAIVLTSFGSFIIYEARALPYSSEFGPGPGFFPLWIGIGIVVCALVMIGADCLRRNIGSEETIKLSEIAIARALGAWFAFTLAIALLSLLGFALSLALLTAFLILVLDRRSSWVALSVAVGLALGFHLVFTVALGVSLPVGPLGF
jgi:putative tricarboxylic transport membrane protein